MNRKICCYCESWKSGGIESFLVNILRHMDRSGLEIRVCTLCQEETVYDAALREMGIPVLALGGPQAQGPLRTILCAPRFFQEMRRGGYDVVHLNLYHGVGLLYGALARWAGVSRVIAHSHNTRLRQSPGLRWKELFHRLGKWMFAPFADERWACSGEAAAFLFPKRYLGEVEVIPNGIELEQFRFDPERAQAIREELGLKGRFVIGHVGRLCSQKNQAFLLRVFARLKGRCPNAALLLIGEGEDREMLTKLARELEISGDLLFLGNQTEIPPLLWAMDVFAFPSIFEGLGIAVIEAQAAGLPVLCAQGLPLEVKATGLVKFLPLQEECWVEELLLSQRTAREDWTQQLARCGYRIAQVSRRVRDAYLQEGK